MTDNDGSVDTAALENQQTSSHKENSSDPNLSGASLNDPALAKKPRDARLIHMILAHYGVTSYQERVPLQLMDLAYRYTSSTLQDALHFTNEGYGTAAPGIGTSAGGGKGVAESNTVNVAALRLAIHSRTHYQYNPTLPKEYYMDLAQEKNRIALPPVQKEYGMKLPPEQYLLTGQGWEMAEEFDMMEGEAAENEGDISMLDQEVSEHGGEDVEGGTMEDIFGPEGGGGGEGDEGL